jgi:hypothetical protein
MTKTVLLMIPLLSVLPVVCGCGSAEVGGTALDGSAEKRESLVPESGLRKADALLAQVSRLTDEYVHRRAPMIDKDRMDALTFAEEAYTILLSLQDKYPGRPEVESRLRRACNLLEFLKHN